MANLLLIEQECGGSQAAGGGCGAPLALFRVSEERFNNSRGVRTGRITAHNPDEHSFDEDDILDVKLEYCACSSCRR